MRAAGIGTFTAWRYVTEAVALLAARAPKLKPALRAASAAGHAFVVLDGTLVPVDRDAADRPSCSGKHRKHGMNLQVIASPSGDILWVSGALPGAVHDLTAARIWGIVREVAAAGLVTLADKDYIGAGEPVRTPYHGWDKVSIGSSQPELAGQGAWYEPDRECSCWWERLSVAADHLSCLGLPGVSCPGRRVLMVIVCAHPCSHGNAPEGAGWS
jgi:hypothetical protein